ncbi:MAG: endolytic transglycosylase MltG [Flavobacteriales bacterium]
MKKIIRFGIIVTLILGSILGYHFAQKIFLEKTQKEGFIYISSKASFEDVKKEIEPFVKNMKHFEWVANQKNYPNVIKAGKYKIAKGWNNNNLINHLRSGNQEEVNVQFNNIETVSELAGKIAKQLETDSLAILNYVFQPDFLKKNNLTRENVKQLFLPNTYNFYWNTSAKQFVDRMKKEYQKFWNSERKKKADKLGMNPLQIISLASIVEKETAKRDERPKVAGLYLNRLQKKWKLQSDPTVIYAVKQRVGFDTIIKRVLFKHLKEDSPYNTYLNYGVPPAPINIPEPGSIDAVLNASKHDYMYMCASVKNWGYHEFASSLSEHEVNRKKYINWLNENQKKE